MDAEYSRAELATLGSALAVVVGSIGPWVRAGAVTSSLVSGDAIFSLVFGLLCCWIVLVEEWHRRAAIVVAAFGMLSLVVAGRGFLEISGAVGNEPTLWLYLALVGSVGLVTAGAVGYNDLGDDAPS